MKCAGMKSWVIWSRCSPEKLGWRIWICASRRAVESGLAAAEWYHTEVPQQKLTTHCVNTKVARTNIDAGSFV